MLQRPYKIRAASPGAPFKEMTVPPDCPLKLGQEVIVITDTTHEFLLAVARGLSINEDALRNLVGGMKEKKEEPDGVHHGLEE